ncbi:MAG TPA: ATP-binding cassette domain-containing protein, partial [Gemmataceae bacterium]|nr:ATP-binding cassette domain-containing protein [Gemmataceae bacterium]
MAVLSVHNLTMRFGGITAVNRVDLAVEPGQIFSVIGPNGAGKTTVFNAITGIYEPTEGEVLFHGKQLAQPLSWKPIAGAVVVGLLTAIAALLFAVNIDTLWKVTIRDNFTDTKAPFPLGKAVEAFGRHIADRAGRASAAFIGGLLV